MVSVAIRRRGVIMPVDEWRNEEKMLSRRFGNVALGGVGEAGDDRHERGMITHVIRRVCRPTERALVHEPYFMEGV